MSWNRHMLLGIAASVWLVRASASGIPEPDLRARPSSAGSTQAEVESLRAKPLPAQTEAAARAPQAQHPVESGQMPVTQRNFSQVLRGNSERLRSVLERQSHARQPRTAAAVPGRYQNARGAAVSAARDTHAVGQGTLARIPNIPARAQKGTEPGVRPAAMSAALVHSSTAGSLRSSALTPLQGLVSPRRTAPTAVLDGTRPRGKR